MFSFNPLNKLKTNQSAQGIKPQLDLRFAEDLALDSRVDFSRGSNATVVDSDGTLKWAGHNLLQYSQEFDNAAWQKFDTTVTANDSVAPDGTLTADKLTTDVATTNSFAIRASVSHTGSTYSVFAKADEKDKILLFGSGKGYGFNLTSGSSFSVGGISDSDSNSMTDVGDGWYRCSISVSSGSFVDIYILNSTSYASYTGDGTSGIYIWGAHLYRSDKEMQERTDVATGLETYYPTTASAYYAPRFDHDPATNESLGLLIEEARTNELEYSEEFDDAYWGTNSNAGTLLKNATGPDGQTSAYTLVDNAGTGSGPVYIVKTPFAVSASTEYTLSIFAKADQINFLAIGTHFFTTPANGNTWFDLSSGTLGTVHSPHTASIEDFGNGWHRCSITFTTDASDTSGVFRFYSCESDNATNVDLDGTSSILVFGAQLEEAAFPTSYIPTSGSTVTRSADVASVATSAFGFSQDEGTFFTEAQTFVHNNSHRVLALSDGTTSNRIIMQAHTANHLFVGSGGVTQAALDAGRYYSNQYSKHSAAYQEDNFGACLDGGTVVTDTSGTIPTVDNVNIGVGATANFSFLNGHIKQLTYFARRLDDATLQALTQPSLEPSLNLVFDSSETSYVNTGLTR